MSKSKKSCKPSPETAEAAIARIAGSPPNLVAVPHAAEACTQLTKVLHEHATLILAHLMQKHGVSLHSVVAAIEAASARSETNPLFLVSAASLIEGHYYGALSAALEDIGVEDEDDGGCVPVEFTPEDEDEG